MGGILSHFSHSNAGSLCVSWKNCEPIGGSWSRQLPGGYSLTGPNLSITSTAYNNQNTSYTMYCHTFFNKK